MSNDERNSIMRFSEDKLDQLLCSDGVNRPIHIWQPEKPKAVMIAVHGGMAHAGDYVTPALYFKQRGWATVSFDMVGHNRQKRVLISTFDAFLDDLNLFIIQTKAQYSGLPLVLVGHSMGALITAHYGLRHRAEDDTAIKGYVMSSPYFGSALKTPKLLLMFASILAKYRPNFKVPLEDYIEVLTRDPEITERHKRDVADDYRASEASARFANELLKAQQALSNSISRWDHPLFIAVAGQDRLADAALTEQLANQITPDYVEYNYYPDNYHENFNELNREEIFGKIEDWADRVLGIGHNAE